MTRLELGGLVLELTDEQADEARRQLGIDRPSVGPVDLATAAEVLGCSRDFLYDHAPEYGGWKVGSRWKFDPARLTCASSAAPVAELCMPQQKPARKPRRNQRKQGSRLLEIRGPKA
jgi:hypothetical protein